MTMVGFIMSTIAIKHSCFTSKYQSIHDQAKNALWKQSAKLWEQSANLWEQSANLWEGSAKPVAIAVHLIPSPAHSYPAANAKAETTHPTKQTQTRKTAPTAAAM